MTDRFEELSLRPDWVHDCWPEFRKWFLTDVAAGEYVPEKLG